MTVAAVAPPGREEKHGNYVDSDDESHRRETIAAVAAAAAACHRRETIAAAAAAAAEACHHRETSVAVAAVAAVCHRRVTSVDVAAAATEACHCRETSVAAAAAGAAEVCHRREIPYHRPFVDLRLPRPPRPETHGRRQEHGGSMVSPAHPPPAIVSQFHEPCLESRRNGWCFLVSGGSVGDRPRSLFSRHRNIPGAGGE